MEDICFLSLLVCWQSRRFFEFQASSILTRWSFVGEIIYGWTNSGTSMPVVATSPVNTATVVTRLELGISENDRDFWLFSPYCALREFRRACLLYEWCIFAMVKKIRRFFLYDHFSFSGIACQESRKLPSVRQTDWIKAKARPSGSWRVGLLAFFGTLQEVPNVHEGGHIIHMEWQHKRMSVSEVKTRRYLWLVDDMHACGWAAIAW